MILTEIFVVMCTMTGAQCFNYVDVAAGILSPAACEQAIQEVVREHVASGTALSRDRSSCSRKFITTQNDRDS